MDWQVKTQPCKQNFSGIAEDYYTEKSTFVFSPFFRGYYLHASGATEKFYIAFPIILKSGKSEHLMRKNL